MVPKMTEKLKKEYFEYLASHSAEIESDQAFVDATIDEHLKFVPHKKLYKFRTCSNKHLKTLEENCIWIPPAAHFDDRFDSTINIDIKRNKKEIQEWLNNNYFRLCYYIILQIFTQLKIPCPLTFEEIEAACRECIDSNGNIIRENEKAFLKSKANESELYAFDSFYDNFIKARVRLERETPVLIEQISLFFDDVRTSQRGELLTYCMAEHYDIRSLWENYAGKYTGFCIEYCFDGYKTAPRDIYKNLLYLVPMTYRRRTPYFDVVRFMDGAIREHIGGDSSWRDSPELEADLNMQFYYKNSDYDYEKEWRFSIKNRNNSKQPFPFVSAIYAGKDIKPRNLQRLKKIAKKLRVPLYRQEQRRFNREYSYIPVEEVTK